MEYSLGTNHRTLEPNRGALWPCTGCWPIKLVLPRSPHSTQSSAFLACASIPGYQPPWLQTSGPHFTCESAAIPPPSAALQAASSLTSSYTPLSLLWQKKKLLLHPDPGPLLPCRVQACLFLLSPNLSFLRVLLLPAQHTAKHSPSLSFVPPNKLVQGVLYLSSFLI